MVEVFPGIRSKLLESLDKNYLGWSMTMLLSLWELLIKDVGEELAKRFLQDWGSDSPNIFGGTTFLLTEEEFSNR